MWLCNKLIFVSVSIIVSIIVQHDV